MTKHLILFLTLVFGTAFLGPDPSVKPLRVSQLLQRVQNSEQMQASKQLAILADDLHFDAPLVKTVGLRFGADDFADASLRYGVSLSINSPQVRRLYRLNDKTYRDFYYSKQNARFNQVLSERCQQIAGLFTCDLLLAKQKQLDSLLQIQNKALRASLEMGIPVSAKTLVAAEDDQRDAQLSIQRLSSRTLFLRQQLAALNAGKEAFFLEDNGFITASKIGEILKNLQRAPWANQQTPLLVEAQEGLKLAELGYKSQVASDKQLLDGFQFIHQLNNDPLLGGGLSFRFGVNIPLRGGDILKQNKLHLEMKEAENEIELLSIVQRNSIKAQALKVEGILSTHTTIEAMFEKSLVKKLLETPSMLATLPATELVELRIVQCKKEIELIESYEELLTEYIILMEQTGELVKMPLRNYLNESLELL